MGLFKINDDGTMTFVGGKLVDGKLVVEMTGFSKYVFAEVKITFNDVSTHWARKDIELMASKYIVTGMPDGSFNPNEQVTRAQFAVMLVNAMGVTGNGQNLSFSLSL